jgi:hypothetical protein
MCGDRGVVIVIVKVAVMVRFLAPAAVLSGMHLLLWPWAR